MKRNYLTEKREDYKKILKINIMKNFRSYKCTQNSNLNKNLENYKLKQKKTFLKYI